MINFKAEAFFLGTENFEVIDILANDAATAKKELESVGYDVIRIWPVLTLVK